MSETLNEQPKYPHNELEGYGNGCLLDLRVRFAMDLLKHSPMYSMHALETGSTPEALAVHALDVATELLKLGAERGLVDPLPADDGELTPELRAQARRTASYNALQQMEANKFAQSEQARVVPQAGPALFPGGRVN